MTDKIYKLARPKLAGVPFQILNGKVTGGIKSRMALEILGGLPSFGGEIVVGPPEADDCYARSKAFTDDENGIQLFVAWVYDLQTTESYPLRKRLEIAESFVHTCGPNTQYVDHELIESQGDLDKYVAKVVGQGLKGVMLREPFGTFGTEDEEATLPTSAGA